LKPNDGALRGFIQCHVSPADAHLIAHLMFETQIDLLLKALQIEQPHRRSGPIYEATGKIPLNHPGKPWGFSQPGIAGPGFLAPHR
jgi:hypothetical protein